MFFSLDEGMRSAADVCGIFIVASFRSLLSHIMSFDFVFSFYLNKTHPSPQLISFGERPYAEFHFRFSKTIARVQSRVSVCVVCCVYV